MSKTQINQKYNKTKILNFNIFSQKAYKPFLGLILALFMLSGGQILALDMSDSELNSEISQTNEKLLNLRKQQNSLENQIKIFDLQVELAQQQVNETLHNLRTTEEKINMINTKIKEQEDLLKKKEEHMGVYLRNIYMDGQTSYLELIASSSNFSDFMNRAEYFNSIA